jgi:mRNA interferase RelE/StbE
MLSSDGCTARCWIRSARSPSVFTYARISSLASTTTVSGSRFPSARGARSGTGRLRSSAVLTSPAPGSGSDLSYQVIWDVRALSQATAFLKDDQHGLEQLFAAVDLLAEDPRPNGSAEYRSPDVRRLYVGRYRALYEINEATVAVVVIHTGRVG